MSNYSKNLQFRLGTLVLKETIKLTYCVNYSRKLRNIFSFEYSILTNSKTNKTKTKSQVKNGTEIQQIQSLANASSEEKLKI